jgi:rare lipoprotein A
MKRVIWMMVLMGSMAMSYAQTFFGEASYYGPGFHGKKTASGEIYSQNKLTAAHKTLPLGTILKVTNAQNNRSVFVRVNDRGPYIKGRIIDVSTKAAEILGFKTKGKAYVKLEVVNLDSIPTDFVSEHPDLAAMNGIGLKDSSKDESINVTSLDGQQNNDSTVQIGSPKLDANTNKGSENEPAPGSVPKEVQEANTNGMLQRPYFVIANLDQNNSGFYGVQLGVFSDPAALFALIAELQAKYKQAMVVQTMEADNKTLYKLFIGKYQNRAYADALKSVLSNKYSDSFVVKYE